MLRGIGTFLLVLVIMGAVPCFYIYRDIQRDRSHTIDIRGPVSVYVAEYPPERLSPKPAPIAIVGPKDHPQVRRIRYGKDYMAIRVRLNDGREGWIFAGDNFQVREKGLDVP